jgi:ribosome-binding factor A
MEKFPGVLASIPYVRVSPDLMVVKVYITTFPDQHVFEVTKDLNANAWDIRKQLAHQVRNEVRKIPEISYFADDTIQYAQKMEEIFSKIHKENEGVVRPEDPQSEA